MDILEFINSTAIRKHLEEINYEFSTLEAAWIIYQSIFKTMKEKHSAWNQLIAEMPDCEMPERNNCIYQSSLHNFLESYMRIEKELYQTFKKDEEDALYQYRFYCTGDMSWCEDYETLYRTEEDCWNMIAEDMDLPIEIIEIRKNYVGQETSIEAVYNTDKELLKLSSYKILDEADSDIRNCSFEGLWFDIPIPFKRGDIVVKRMMPGPYERVAEKGAFVLEGATPLDKVKHRDCIPEEMRDNSDMNAWGYFQDPDGRVFREVMSNYMDLEYYEEPIEGRLRLLKAISSFLTGKIDISLLLTTYRKVILDEFTKDIMLTNWFSDEGLENAGLLKSIKK